MKKGREMIVVIACAGSKNRETEGIKTKDGDQVEFVAHPEKAMPIPGIRYAHPDDHSGYGVSWRKWLEEYNKNPGSNPKKLLQAFQLYKPPIYRKLVNEYGAKNVFILSAGWGLIESDFLTPHYDITFSNMASREKRRHYEKDILFKKNDLCQLPKNTDGPIVFLGGKDYAPLFSELTRSWHCRKIVFYASQLPPLAPGCDLVKYTGGSGTNWHYRCAQDLIDCKVAI